MLAALRAKTSLVESLFPRGVELDCPVTVISGKIPLEIRGTLYHNRPGNFRLGSVAYHHWLDGDGFLTGLWISGGTAWLKSRFVQTTKRREEAAAESALFRGFGTSFPGDQLKDGVATQSPANIHVRFHGQRLLAFAEQGAPVEIDPRTLETLGEDNFGGLLAGAAPFSAHAKMDGNEMLNFGIEYHPTRPRLHYYSFGKTNRTGAASLDGPRSAHDFAITSRHLVFHLPPYFFDMGKLTRGRPVVDCYAWRPERGLRLWLVDRNSLEVVRRLEVEGRYAMHVVNAFEKDGATHLDVLEHSSPLYADFAFDRFFQRPMKAELARYTLTETKVERRLLWDYDRMPDFPVLEPGAEGQETRAVWGLGCSVSDRTEMKFHDELWRWDGGKSEVFRLPEGQHFAGDPVLAGTYVTVFVAGGPASEVWIFAKANLKAGPVTRLRLPARLPIPIHGTFSSA